MNLKKIEYARGVYYISDSGRLFNYDVEIIGYVQRYRKCSFFDLNYGKVKTKYFHKLVAEHFVENINPKENICVNHINGNKLDNRACNLEWVTAKRNSNHAKEIGLYPKGQETHGALHTDKIAQEIRAFRRMFKKHSLKKLAKIYDVNYNTLLGIVYGKTYSHV